MKKVKLYFLFALTVIAHLKAENPENIITDYLLTLMKKAAYTDFIGEEISQYHHAIQTAHHVILKEPNNHELTIAALFHDIAHQLQELFKLPGNKWGVFNHGPIGAKFLEKLGFSNKVCHLIKNHAAAKRYLAQTEEYLKTLSLASQETLKQQGNVMTPQEAKEFIHDPFFHELIMLRQADDKAKEINLEVNNIEFYKTVIIEHLRDQFKNNSELADRALTYLTSFNKN